MATKSKRATTALDELGVYAAVVRSGQRDPYVLLGVPPAADTEAVRSAWLALVKRFHPDRHPDRAADAHTVTAALNTARDTLCDPVKRRKYDTVNKVAAGQCKACSGKGVVLRQKGFGKKVPSTCVVCGGTGSE